MTTLVTGGTGFVGAYVVRQLLGQGQRVVCFDLAPQRIYLEDLLGGQLPDAVTLIRGDITDLVALAAAVKVHEVTQIVHLAAMIGPAAEEQLAASFAVNATGTLNVFEVARLLDVQRVVWASSIGVFGPRSLNSEGRLDGQSVPDPSSAYGTAKAACEQMARLYARTHGTTIIGLRFSTVYGYGKQYFGDRRTWLDELLAKPARGEAGCSVPGGKGSFDFQYVEDAAGAVLAALKADVKGGRTYLTCGDQRPVREAVDLVNTLLPASALVLEDRTTFMVYGGDGEGTRFMFRDRTTATDRLIDASDAEHDLGFVPGWPIERAFPEVIQMYAKQGTS